ncbi:hypothetical protein KGF57_000588 [Candida theae]|uniref:Protein HID1 n=1 Tax=Candida theae TaxID=1198502 RepID=A0AAD5BIJ7_9ASCO|nr:uncharacterized protein KGF57_000588 [Candida theae]KAI5966624.1 hypothetical protein KGF57_000588 [Candida theae]
MKSSEERIQFKRDFLSLGQGRIISRQDVKFWSRFWKLPTKSQDIFELLSLEDVRSIRRQNVVNYITFVQVLSLKVVEIAGFESLTDNDISSLLNCIRFLAKLLPPLLEQDDYFVGVCYETFWNTEFSAEEYLRSKEVELSDSEEDVKRGISFDALGGTIGMKLLMASVDLLFTKGFTINTKDKGGVSWSVWEPGLGFAGKARSPNLIIDINRVEVLKLIITLCSDGFYCSSSAIVSTESIFLTILVSMTPKVKLLTMVSSLLNLTCRASQDNDVSMLYYENINYTETRFLSVAYAFSLLTMMIVYPIPSQPGITGCKLNNMTRRYLGKVHKEQELVFIVNSLMNVLRLPFVKSAGGGGSFGFGKSNPPSLWATETVIFIWEMIQCNKHFKEIVANKYAPELMVLLLYYSFEHISNDSKRNLVRVCAYLSLYLSSKSEILETLFYPMPSSLYDSLPQSFKSSIAPLTTRDFLVSQLCALLLNAYPIQPPTYTFKPLPKLLLNSLVETLYNLIIPVSNHELKVRSNPDKRLNNPNARGGLSYQASSLVTQLISRFSTKSFLLEKSHHLNVVALLVRAVSMAVVKYPHPSRMLLFCVLKNERVYENLWSTIFNIQEYTVRGDVISKIEENGIHPATSYNANGDTIARSSPIPITPRKTEESLSLSENESVESSLRPRLPPGMSEKAKDKQRRDSPIGQVWPGRDALAIIITIVIPHLKRILSTLWSGTKGASVDSFELVEKIGSYDFSIMIEENRKQFKYEVLSETPLEQLEFEWSLLSLGWYLSLLYSEVYNTSSKVKAYIGSNNGMIKHFSASLNTVSKITSNWTTFFKQEQTARQSDDEFTSQWVENGLTNVNAWQGTDIKLFDVVSASNGGLFANLNKLGGGSTQAVPNTPGSLNDMMRRFSDFNISGVHSSPVSSVLSTPVEEQESYFTRRAGRNSVTSLHSLNKLNRMRSNTPRNSFS